LAWEEKLSKRMAELRKQFDTKKQYTLEEAIDLIKNNSSIKFDETVEIHIRLGIDPKQSNQTVRGTVALPHGVGKNRKVAVIAKGEKLKEAEESGADYFGSEDLIAKISKGWFEFDSLVATPDSMKELARLGKLLGPRGLMPNPKSGTVTFDIKKTVNELKAGRIEFKNDSAGIIHSPAGKVSFDKEKLLENIKKFIDGVAKSKPASSKGQFIKKLVISSTMGPGLNVIYGGEA
jgi:large subunit ribosomal protein L1